MAEGVGDRQRNLNSIVVDDLNQIEQFDDLNQIEQFVLLGVSKYSNYEDIIRVVDILIKNLRKGPGQVDAVITLLEDISTNGRSMNQDAIFLCLVMCYVHSEQLGRAAIGEKIIEFCRIPTHLFTLLKMLKEYLDQGASLDTPCNTEEYYEVILYNRGSNIGSNNEKPKSSVASKPEENKTKQKLSSFVTKHKFISNWYSDPKKSASDLLLLFTKYQKREGWDQREVIKFSHPKIDEDEEESREKQIVVQYYLNGFKKIKKDYDQFITNPTGGTERKCRVYKFIEVLEEVKKIMNEKEEKQGDRVEKMIKLIQENKRVQLDPLRSSYHESISYQSNISSFSSQQSTTSRNSDFDTDPGKVSRLHLTIEHIPSSMYNEKGIFKELINDMPMIAMLRNMSHMSRLGLFDEEDAKKGDGDENDHPVDIVKKAFSNQHRLYPFIHPFQIMKTLVAYEKGESGYGAKKKNWEVKTDIGSILRDAFFLSVRRNERKISFDNCVVCIDNSEPMHQQGFLGVAMLNAAMASVALATAITKMGINNSVYLCNSTAEEMDVSNLMKAIHCVEGSSVSKSPSNLARPITDAIKNSSQLSAVIVFTKSIEEYICGESVYEAFKELRHKMKYSPDEGTKLIIVSMEANGNVLADLSDPNVHVVCGGDADVLVNMKSHIKRESSEQNLRPEFEGME